MYIPYTGSIFTVSNYKHIQTSIAIFIGNKVTENLWNIRRIAAD